MVPDATRDRCFAENVLVRSASGLRAYAGLSLSGPDGLPLDTLCVLDRTPRQFMPEALDLLAGLARTVETTSELRRAVSRLHSRAMPDAFTDLPNRLALMDALERTIALQQRDGVPFSMLHLDMGGLDRIRGAEGQVAGDEVLRCIVSVLRACTRKEDFVAHIADDEFAASLAGGDGAEASVAAERVGSGVHAAMRTGDWDVTHAVGSACFLAPPADAHEALAAVRGQLSAAKRAGINRIACRDVLGRGAEAEAA